MKNFAILTVFLFFGVMSSYGQHFMGQAPIGSPTTIVSTPLTAINGLDMAYTFEATSNNFVRFPLTDFSTPQILFNQTFAGFIGTAEYVPQDSYYFVDQSNWVIYKANFDASTTNVQVTMTDPDNSFGPGSYSVTGIAYYKAANIFYAAVTDGAQSYLYTLNIETGVLSYVGFIGNFLVIDIAVDVSGNLYAIDIIGDILVSVNTSTGAGTTIGSIGFDANYGQSMDFDDDTNTLYYAAFNNGTFSAQIRTVNVSTGSTTLIEDLGFSQYTAFTIKRQQSVKAVPVPWYFIGILFLLLPFGVIVRRRFF